MLITDCRPQFVDMRCCTQCGFATINTSQQVHYCGTVGSHIPLTLTAYQIFNREDDVAKR